MSPISTPGELLVSLAVVTPLRLEGSERVVLGLGHKNYGHMAVLSAENRAALAKDFA